jgi:hypothetical protein
MSEDKGRFTVADKRHFEPDGTPRSSEPGSSRARSATGDAPVATLSALFLSLAAQASLLLREASPASDESEKDDGLPPADPEGARQVVAILEMLEEKTEGRRTAEESELLGDALYQLRMAYLARTRGQA